jgi:hypothetical protein
MKLFRWGMLVMLMTLFLQGLMRKEVVSKAVATGRET